MGERVVTTQVELDAAFADTTDQRTIYIDSPASQLMAAADRIKSRRGLS